MRLEKSERHRLTSILVQRHARQDGKVEEVRETLSDLDSFRDMPGIPEALDILLSVRNCNARAKARSADLVPKSITLLLYGLSMDNVLE